MVTVAGVGQESTSQRAEAREILVEADATLKRRSSTGLKAEDLKFLARAKGGEKPLTTKVAKKIR